MVSGGQPRQRLARGACARGAGAAEGRWAQTSGRADASDPARAGMAGGSPDPGRSAIAAAVDLQEGIVNLMDYNPTARPGGARGGAGKRRDRRLDPDLSAESRETEEAQTMTETRALVRRRRTPPVLGKGGERQRRGGDPPSAMSDTRLLWKGWTGKTHLSRQHTRLMTKCRQVNEGGSRHPSRRCRS
jgi:hypothetical protein